MVDQTQTTIPAAWGPRFYVVNDGWDRSLHTKGLNMTEPTTPHTTNYIRIHFAPSTDCVDVKLTQDEFDRLSSATDKHQGEVTITVSSHREMKVASQ